MHDVEARPSTQKTGGDDGSASVGAAPGSPPASTSPVLPAVAARLNAIAGGDRRPVPPQIEDDAANSRPGDPLRQARSVALGLALVVPFWVAVAAGLWAWMR